MESINNTVRILLMSFVFCFTGCVSSSNRSFNSLSFVFDSWFLMHHPEFSDNLDPYNFYIKNKKGDLEYFDEYLFDLKRFQLELSQINQRDLNNYNNKKYIALDEKITLLVSDYSYRSYNSDPSYYVDFVNNHILNLLLYKNIPNDEKVTLINNTLNYIPKYFNRIKKSLLVCNNYSMDKAINSLDITNRLLENIPLYVELEDSSLRVIETKIYENKNSLLLYKSWFLNNLNNEELLDYKEIASLIEDHTLNLQNKYQHKNILNSLKSSIENLKNNILNLALPMYMLDKGKTILNSSIDTLTIVNYIIKTNNQKENFNKNYSSKIIDFNKEYEKLISFIKSSNIINNREMLLINFPDYNTLFDELNDIRMVNLNYDTKKINVIINPSTSQLSKTDMNLFIVEEILTRNLYNLSSKRTRIDLYNQINHYAWSKLLSDILIDNGYDSIHTGYKFSHNMKLLQDFIKIFVKHKYYNGSINKEEAINILIKDGLLDPSIAQDIWEEIIYQHSKNNLEHYVSYIYLSNLFDLNCILNNRMSHRLFLEKIFQYGFLPIHNYKSILN